jgi:nicotinate-nucleotide pyrophosphorylase (carboxylating)
MRTATRDALNSCGLNPAAIEQLCKMAVDEDLNGGMDVTSVATIDPNEVSTADFVVRKPGVVAGVPVLAAMLETHLGDNVDVELRLVDGARVSVGDIIATVRAPTVVLLTVERSALNLLCHLSGVATLTRRWVDAVAATKAQIRDTRKILPGFRDLDKYAVRCGGGVNHRRGLHDAVLIKDNHVVAAGGVAAALDAVHRRFPNTGSPEAGRPGSNLSSTKPLNVDMVVQCEIDRLSQLHDVLTHGADQILLDNMSVEDMAAAVREVKAVRPEVLVEASGGLSLEVAAAVAQTGVDFLAVGALTHSAPILDIALDFRT